MFWQTGRGGRPQRRMVAWTRYLARYDKLTDGQPSTCDLMPPIKTNNGFWRAEGWDTRKFVTRRKAFKF